LKEIKMITLKTAILAGTAIVGLVGLTGYATGSFCPAVTAQVQTSQAILTSGGSDACRAADLGDSHAMTQGAVFTPTVQSVSAQGGSCPVTTKQNDSLTSKTSASAGIQTQAGESCGRNASVTTAALTGDGKSCCANPGAKSMTSKTTLAGTVPASTSTN
jgi:hypothetical protein